MDSEAIRTFLSVDAINAHLEYLQYLKNKYSILEKSIDDLRGKSIRQILRSGLPRDIKSEALIKIAAVKSHELYFSSFVPLPGPCTGLREHYSSESAFLYELSEIGMQSEAGFMIITRSRNGKPQIHVSDGINPYLGKDSPLLAIDLYEHAYFSDYGFDKRAYLQGALSHLDLSKIFSEGNSQIYLDTKV